MKAVASADQELSVEERNLLSVAYKNVTNDEKPAEGKDATDTEAK